MTTENVWLWMSCHRFRLKSKNIDWFDAVNYKQTINICVSISKINKYHVRVRRTLKVVCVLCNKQSAVVVRALIILLCQLTFICTARINSEPESSLKSVDLDRTRSGWTRLCRRPLLNERSNGVYNPAGSLTVHCARVRVLQSAVVQHPSLLQRQTKRRSSPTKWMS